MKPNRAADRSFLALFLLLAVVLACSSGASDARQAPSEYVGTWRGSDGQSIVIRADGSADWRSGSSKVTGGTAKVSDSEKTLTIKLASLMGPTFKIDKAPQGDVMTLDGVGFRKVDLSQPPE